jgi:hypothetical protein
MTDRLQEEIKTNNIISIVKRICRKSRQIFSDRIICRAFAVIRNKLKNVFTVLISRNSSAFDEAFEVNF